MKREAVMGGKQAILFVHGFMGCSEQFDSVISALSGEQADIYNITLPGHGATLSEFVLSGDRDWQTCVNGYIDRLRPQYDSIILVGHSMGGLLHIEAIRTNADKIKAIVAVALPLCIKLSLSGMRTRLLAVTAPKESDDPAVASTRAMCGVSGLSLGSAYKLVPNTFGLLRTIRRARAALPSLRTKTIVINSHNDEVVSVKTVRLAEGKSPFVSSIMLDEASHFMYTDGDIDVIAGQIRRLLNDG